MEKLDILTPQRFYQCEFKTDYESIITTVIDLKVVSEISLIESQNKKEIMINMNSYAPPRVITLDKSEVATEAYKKLVSAWTTYKLATER